MKSVRATARGVFLTLIGATLLSGHLAWAGSVSVNQKQCGGEVTLVADDAMLSDIFRELAAELGFALVFDRESDRPVSIESKRVPEKLIESLTREDNVMITTEGDPNCAGGDRIKEVRFIGAGNPIVVPAHVPATAAPMPSASRTGPRAASLKVDNEKKDQVKKMSRRDMTPEQRAEDRERQRRERRR